jgi:hypothetical protein
MQRVTVGIDGLIEKICTRGDLTDAELAAKVVDPRTGEQVTPTSVYRWRTGMHRPRRWAIRILVSIAAGYKIEVQNVNREKARGARRNTRRRVA